jgi:ABC-type branched-subunit amino acid transport system substrate-binding protein
LNRLRWIAIALTLPIVIAACGRGSSTTATSPPNSSNGSTPATQAGIDQGAFGTLGKICQPAKDPSALKATDVGVTANSINVTTFADPGYSGAKGLDQELFDTAASFANWCNKFGGLNGRMVHVTLADAALLQAEQRMVEACDAKTFMAVGGGVVFDDTQQADRLGCKSGAIPQVAGYLVTAKASGSDLTKQPIPNPGNVQPVGAYNYLKQKYPQDWSHIGVMTGEIATTETVAKQNEEALKTLGAKVVYQGLYPPQGTDNWRPYVSAMQANGVKGLYWVGQPAGLGQMVSAAKGLGLKLDFIQTDANHYDNTLFTNASPSSAANGIYVRSAVAPFLSGATEGTATKQYTQIVQNYDDCSQYVTQTGGTSCTATKKIAYLGDQAMSAWLLWAKGVNACGANVTRDCVWAALNKITSWTGGGLHAQTDPGTGAATDCYVLFQAENGKFVIPSDFKANTGIYDCDPSNLVPLHGNYGTGAKCPGAAFASDPIPSKCNS